MLSGISVLDVAIGLSFVYLVLSLLCSSANEGLEAVLKNRSRQLERGVREILSDPGGDKITHLIYNHPLISGLFQGSYEEAKAVKDKLYRGTNLPSYIPSANFALALLDVIMPSTPSQPGGASGAIAGDGAPQQAEVVAELRKAAVACPSAKVSQALVLLIDASSNDIVRVRGAIEGWFNSSMDRVAGWYKRRAQIIIFCVAAVMVTLLNVDTIAIANRLITDPAVRNSLVATAQEYARSNNGIDRVQAEVNVKRLGNLGLPLGWELTNSNDPTSASSIVSQRLPRNFYEWALKLAGLLASALAASLGAPFWFDLLNKVMVIRSTVKPQEKSPKEKSKD